MPHQQFLQNKFKEVARFIQPTNSKFKILDIGCNNGNIRNFLPKNIEYFGVDIDNEFIHQLQQKGIKAKQADLNKQELPFQFERFNYILILDLLEHVVNPRQLLIQARQKLNPNGKLIITLPNDYHILNRLRFLFNKPITNDPFAPFGHLHYFPVKVGEQFLKNNQFKILKKCYLSSNNPESIPKSIKDFLSKLSPQLFVRDVLYLLEMF